MTRRGFRAPSDALPSTETPRKLAVSKIETEDGVMAIFSIDLPSAGVKHALTDAEREVVNARRLMARVRTRVRSPGTWR